LAVKLTIILVCLLFLQTNQYHLTHLLN